MASLTCETTLVRPTWMGHDNSDDANLGPLYNQHQKILELWERFNQIYPDGNPSDHVNTIPTIEMLYQAIDQAQTAWQDKQARGLRPIRDKFFNFAETMNEYSYLFSIIPNGDKYTSLITGVVSSVVKVSVNYKKVAEGFSEALSDISDHLRSVKKISKGSDSHDMRQHVIKLYCEVFELLCHALTWFTSKRKRLGAAFKKNFYDDTVVNLLSRIEKTVTAIDREANYISHGQVREIYERVLDTKLEDRLRSVGIQNRRDGEAAIEGKLGMVREVVGCSDEMTHQLEGGEVVSQATLVEMSSSDELMMSESEDSNAESIDSEYDHCSRFEVERFASHLATYREIHKMTPSSTRGENVKFLPEGVLLRIKQWIDTPESKTIWIQGISSTQQDSVVSRTAARIYDLSTEARLPCIVVFCQPRHDFAKEKNLSQKEASLIAFTYGIVNQLVRLLPTQFQAMGGIAQESFDRLDGSMQSIPAALDLIRALLKHAPSPLIWVVEGLQLVEDRTSMPFLQTFLGVLKEEKTKRISKVCFTTQGNSVTLARGLDFRERASRVICWLVGESSDSNDAMDFVRYLDKMSREKYHIDNLRAILQANEYRTKWTALSNLLSRRWWSRIWTVQEFILPASISFWCGTRSVSRVAMCRSISTADKCTSVGTKETPGFIKGNNRRRARGLHKTISSEGVNVILSLPALADYLSFMDVTDDQDRLYGLMGLCTDKWVPDVNYLLSTEEVCLSFAQGFITHHKSLDIISFASTQSRPCSSWPSWVPSWRNDKALAVPLMVSQSSRTHIGNLRTPAALEVDLSIAYSASGAMEAKFKFEDSTLIAHGVVLDTVDGLAGSRHFEMAQCSEWEPEYVLGISSSPADILTSLCRCLVLDRKDRYLRYHMPTIEFFHDFLKLLAPLMTETDGEPLQEIREWFSWTKSLLIQGRSFESILLDVLHTGIDHQGPTPNRDEYYHYTFFGRFFDTVI
ncbi:hypothetical protein FSPOR_9936 [Fusarium sporotrichioides]|uniref:Uncharacterized protein n=1 Tax=Fusarium sporotrichioides TaxID=5514 RepID=A0A395RN97_FUSSP|nr:hypothetical protein FSPOR_9936 [Fusarium sporotrichioides]